MLDFLLDALSTATETETVQRANFSFYLVTCSELPLGTNGRLEDSWGRSNQVRGDEVQVSREREVLEVDEEDDEQDNNSVGIDDTAAETYRPPGPMNPRASSPFLDKIATCSSLECLKAAHLLPRGVAKFNHPHVLIIGFQKAATTSLFSYVSFSALFPS